MFNAADDEDLTKKPQTDSLPFEEPFINQSYRTSELLSSDSTQFGLDSGVDPSFAPQIKQNEANQADEPRSELDQASVRFEVGAVFAEGGLGEICEARDLELDRDVVVKRIKETYRDHPLSQRRFLREARITGLLEHPGIVPVHGLCRAADGHRFYVMRKVIGMRMEIAIAHFHASNPTYFRHSRGLRDLLHRFIQVCNTVEYAHSKGVIHRDIKPENILFRKYGETLLLDWGLAKFHGKAGFAGADVGSSAERLSFGQYASEQREPASHKSGTIPYMSPEQLMEAGDKVGPRSDIFSLGATLYHILAGVPPKRFSEEEEGLFLLADDAMMSVRALKPEVPRPLEAICRKAMRYLPQDRYATAAELARDIEQWLADEAVSSYEEPIHETLARLARRHQTWLATIFAVLFTSSITLAIAAIMINQERKAARAAERIAGNALNDMTTAKIETTKILLATIQGMPKLADLSTTPESIRKRRRITEDNLDTLENLRSISPDDVAVKQVVAGHLSELGFLSQLEGDLKSAQEYYESSASYWDTLIPLRPNAAVNRENIENDIGNILLLGGRPAEAIPLFEKVITRLEGLPKIDTRIRGHIPFHEAMAYQNLSTALLQTGKPQKALEVADKADELWKAMIADDSLADPVQNLVYIGFVTDRSNQLLAAGKPEEALAIAEPNVARARIALNASRTRMNEAGVFCTAQIVRCRCLRVLKRNLPEVRKDLDEVIAMEESFALDLRSDHHSRARLGEARLERALVEDALGLRVESLADADAARRILEDLTKAMPQMMIYRDSLAETLGELAKLKLQAKETAGVESILEQAIALETQVLKLNPDNSIAKTRLKDHQKTLRSLSGATPGDRE